MSKFDLIVIGGGSGGVRAARVAAALGARVALVEGGALGGTCVNAGCIPKKMLVYASRFRQEFHDAVAYGWGDVSPPFGWPTLIHNKDTAIHRLNGLYDRLLTEAGVHIIRGWARLADAHTVAVDGQSFQARHILIATGGRPSVPDFPGRESVVTSDDAFHLPTLPRRVLVVGGGYIAVEFACIFHGLGAETTLVHRGDSILRGFDVEARGHLTEALRARGLTLQLNTRISAVKRDAHGLTALLAGGRQLPADLILYATGRLPNTAGLGLDRAGVELTASGAVQVDDGFRSSVPSIHALGDVIDRVRLTPVAIAEAAVFARNLFGAGNGRMDYHAIPTAVFSTPELAAVGLNEERARERHKHIKVFRSRFKPTRELLTGSEQRTLVKLIVEATGDRVVGAHMVGDGAAEVIQGLAIAIKSGATKAQIDATIGVHPTVAEEFFTLREAN
ncbi:MAG TPA: glutathione-disulfide reductase [Gammaproteobacteria bacterium]|nr:glutathione-disulfide reductase [Gammaproteobacteria bacterium]